MNLESVKSIFALFIGEDDISTYVPFIQLAMTETEKMLLPDADSSDIRLDFLTSSIAAYRLRQAEASRDNSKYTYAGKMNSNSSNPALLYSERMLRDYLTLCSDLISPKTFVFFGTSSGKEMIPC